MTSEGLPPDPFAHPVGMLDRVCRGRLLWENLNAMDVRQAVFATLAALTEEDLTDLALERLMTAKAPDWSAHAGKDMPALATEPNRG